MSSSRIFVKGLPPTLTQDEFKKHFSQISPVTDAKLFPNRRIGYIGYATVDDAVKATKYFNKSYIRLSRIIVEIARPSDFSALSTRKAKREIEWQAEKSQITQNSALDPTLTPGVKRKRGTYDEADSKLQEFLEVMQPTSKNKSIGKEAPPTSSIYDSLPIEPAAKNDAEIPHVDHDQAGKITQPLEAKPNFPAQRLDNNPHVSINSTDEDWLRSRTSRTLDVLDSNSISLSDFLPKPRDTATTTDINVQSWDNDNKPTDQSNVPADNIVPDNKSELEVTMESIRKTARLFVRNLPYTASEADIRSHFSPYGSMKEVRACIYLATPNMPCDEFPDRDILC
ncbi:pre-rRNA processing protein Mrd1 [Blumeria hordei DH14]|uniref:Pre-rRNA processing protein Mrd1 n=1 Tax=Blumeria graminis f. sp. hordei (strain DH14) TaxID=546991 RepID=N1JPY7_BLUG1|nr:pre-rRNA processing protein Mrd1 [Blumeria hordei DH14]